MPRLKRILFFADGAPGEKAALKRAVTEARHSGAKLWVADLVAEVSTDENSAHVRQAIKKIQKALILERKEVLDTMIADFSHIAHPSIKTLVIPGKDDALLTSITKLKIDLVMKSADKTTALGTLFGHNDMRLLRKCPCPVWIIKPGRKRKINKIVAAIDPLHTGQQLNESILAYAKKIAEMEGAELHVLHTWQLQIDNSMRSMYAPMGFKEKTLQDLADALLSERESALKATLADSGLPYDQAHLLKGSPETIIPRFIEKHEMDLLIMGTVARSGVSGFLIGNTAERLLHNVPCSVLALKPEDFSREP